jgi:thymidine kinase
MSSYVPNAGYLELILGPMYAGKTSKIIDIYKLSKFCKMSVSIVNHSLDTRYHETMLSSHDKIMVPCFQASKLNDVWSNSIPSEDNKSLQESDVILINEGQFFEDLYEVVIDMLNQKKKVHISGLDGDYERKKFGQILDLVPYCDKVSKLTALCSFCKNGTPGIHSKRITGELIQTVIGSENYLPVCRECFEKND